MYLFVRAASREDTTTKHDGDKPRGSYPGPKAEDAFQGGQEYKQLVFGLLGQESAQQRTIDRGHPNHQHGRQQRQKPGSYIVDRLDKGTYGPRRCWIRKFRQEER